MEQNTVIILKDEPNIVELLDILRNNNMREQAGEIAGIAEYIDTMNTRLDSMLNELQVVKQQLNEIKDKKNPVIAVCEKMVQNVEEKIIPIKTQLAEAKNNLIAYAKQTISDFKQKGVSVLNKAMNFLKVKDGLQSIKENNHLAINFAEKAITDIEAISKELHMIGDHTKNIGRVFIGKERETPIEQSSGKIAGLVQKPFRAISNTLSNMDHDIDKAISGLERLGEVSDKHGKDLGLMPPVLPDRSPTDEKPSIKGRIAAIKQQKAAEQRNLIHIHEQKKPEINAGR